jgi:putative glutamine amidotransferase
VLAPVASLLMPQRFPLIGVTVPAEPSPDKDERIQYALKATYADRLLQCGALAFLVLSSLDDERLRAAYELLDGLLLPGGADVDPALYGASPHPKLGRLDPALDRVDTRLVRWSVADGKPLLGICRGSQAINVACGGTLYQDIGSELPHALLHPTQSPNRYRLSHDVQLDADSRVARAMEATELRVNSTHHQAIRDVAPDWRAVGHAPDGVVEAIERETSDDAFAVAVQWHPEELWQLEDAPTRRLFQAFVDAARAWQAAARSEPVAVG